MKTYVFCRRDKLVEKIGGVRGVREVLERIAEGTPTENLVVVVYLMPAGADWAGQYCGKDDGCGKLSRGRGIWAIAPRFPAPDDLPPEYLLISFSMIS